MTILVEPTPNPQAKKFTSPKQMFDGNSSYPLHKGERSHYPILNDLLLIDGVDNVFGYQYFVTIIKDTHASWEDLTPKVKDIMTHYGYDQL